MSAQSASQSSSPSKRNGVLRGRVIRNGDTPASNANIANIITVVRILLAPVFMWLLLLDNGEMGFVRYLAAALFVVAIVTDALDGYLARGRNLVTNVGIILDPIADKVLIGGALIALSIVGELVWWITILVLLREFGITIYRFVVISTVVIPASRGGKLKTIMQAVAVSLFLVPFEALLGLWVRWFTYPAMTIAVLLTVYTGFEYLWQAWRYSRTSTLGV